MNYKEWIENKWLETGGIISQAQASKIIKVSRNTIKDWIKKGKIKSHKFEKDKPLVELREIKVIAEQRSKENKIK